VEILQRLKEVHPRPEGGYTALCPAHDDHRRSLSVHVGADGKVLLHCHAGCKPESVAMALGLEMKDLFPGRPASEDPHRIVAVYDYQDEGGALRYQVVRRADKSFSQRQPDGKGGWTWSLKGVEPLLYRVPELMRAMQEHRTVYIAEGEKDVDNLWRIGLPATTNSGGAGKWRLGFAERFRGADVVVLPDNDEPGRAHALQVAKSLHGTAKSVRVLELPGLARKGDVSDWLQRGGTKEELSRLASATAVWAPSPAPKSEALVQEPKPGLETSGDIRNADRLIEVMAGNMRYCVDTHGWFAWNGRFWDEDAGESALYGYCRKVIARIAMEAADSSSESVQKKLFLEARKLSDVQKQKSMIEQASKIAAIQVYMKDLDRDPFLLTCKGGTIDLRTGRLHAHNREDLITRMVDSEYDPDAICPHWLEFLDLIMDGDPKMIAFLQRAVGYALTGATDERCIFILYGGGRNGKSTFTENIAYLMDGHALKTRSETLLDKKNGDSIPNDIAALKGRRLVYAAETGQGRRLDEDRIKELSGDRDTISARFMRGEWFTFVPTFKIWLHTNYKPEIRGTDAAIWDRIRLVPFVVRIPDDRLRPRRIVDEELKAEWPGILGWAVQGCLDWQQNGLGMPEQVKAGTTAYREESDPLKDFLTDACEVEASERVAFKELWQAYIVWSKASGEHYPMGRKQFVQALRDRGFVEYRETTKARRHLWIGLKLTRSDAMDAIIP
jgi:putative DNA primase/helicase